MKILRIIARLNVGGPTRHVVWLTDRLRRRGFETELVAGRVPDSEEDMGYFATQNGIEPIYISELSRELSPKDAVSLVKVYRELKRFSPDIVHTHTGKAGTVGRTATLFYRWLNVRRPRKLKVVHTFHGHFFHSYYGRLKTLFFLNIEKFLARFATDKIIVISDQQFAEIHERFGVGRREQFSVIPLGIDLSVYEDADENRDILRTEIAAGEDDIVIGIIGRLTEIKNTAMFLEVASRYLARSHSDLRPVKFVVIGDGLLREDLEAKAKDLGLGEKLTFLGHRDDISSLISGLDIVALTSKNEGTPLSLIEAMAVKRPVISTVVGGVSDLLGSAETEHQGFSIHERGIGVHTNSAEDLCSGLIYLVENEKLRKSLAAKAQLFITSKYSLERLENDIASLYEGLVSEDK